MKKIVFISDTHGDKSNFGRIDLTGVDGVVHLGDGAEDCENDAFAAGVSYQAVKGNNDFSSDREGEAVLCFEGVRVLITHGHRYRVKYDLLGLDFAAAENNCTLAVYGHTHHADAQWGSKAFLLNPGSLAGVWSTPSYAVVTFTDGTFSAEIKRI